MIQTGFDFSRAFDPSYIRSEPFDPELMTEGLTAEGLVAGSIKS